VLVAKQHPNERKNREGTAPFPHPISSIFFLIVDWQLPRKDKKRERQGFYVFSFLDNRFFPVDEVLTAYPFFLIIISRQFTSNKHLTLRNYIARS